MKVVEAVTAMLSGLGMIGVAVAAWIMWRRHGVDRKFWRWGAAAWAISVALKFAWAVPVNRVVYTWLQQYFPASIAGPAFWVYVGLLTGIFEVGGSLLVIRYVRGLRDASWTEAVAFGIAFGGTEAALLGTVSLGNAIAALSGVMPPGSFPPGYGPLWIAAPVVERASAILVHLASSLAVFLTVRLGEARWFWISFAYKTAVDSVAAFAQLSYGVNDLARLWTIEAVMILFGIAGLWGTEKLRAHWQD